MKHGYRVNNSLTASPQESVDQGSLHNDSFGQNPKIINHIIKQSIEKENNSLVNASTSSNTSITASQSYGKSQD